MEFDTLVNTTVEHRAVRAAIDSLVEQKKAGLELDEGPRIPEISEFVEAELERLEAPPLAGEAAPSTEELNRLFRQTLEEAWA
jgi:hypothetical protein